MFRIVSLVLITLFLLSCSQPSVTGKWELKEIILSRGEPVTIEVEKGNFQYFTMYFQEDGKVEFSGRTERKNTITYTMQGDTVVFTADNGIKTPMPVLKLTGNEMHTLSTDSNVYVYNRID